MRARHIPHVYAAGGSYLVQLNVTDNHAPPRTDRVTHAVLVNGVPVADDQALDAEDRRSTPITLTATDFGGDPMLFTVLSSPIHGTLTGDAPNLMYRPEAAYRGADGDGADAV